MTDEDIKDIELDYEAVRMSQGWDVGKYVLIDLPDDPQRCVDAVPRLVAEVKRLRQSRAGLLTDLLEGVAEVKRLKAIVNELEGDMTDPGGCGLPHV